MTPTSLPGAVAQVTVQSELTVDFLITAIFVFLVSVVVGTVAIKLGAQVLIDRDTGNRRALATALIGAIVYTAVGYLLGWIPLLGPILMLVAWVAVINWQYPGGWGTAIGIGVSAWIIAVLILFALSQLGLVAVDAVGVPVT